MEGSCRSASAGEFVLELTGAKHSFCMRGWYIALAVTVLGGAVAYFVSGRALKPLKQLHRQGRARAAAEPDGDHPQ